MVPHDTIFANAEDLVLVLQREGTGNRLTVTVQLQQDQQWLAATSREVTFPAGEAHASLLILAREFTRDVTRSGNVTVTVDDVPGYETAGARAIVFVVSTEGPYVTYSLSQPSYTFAEDVGLARTQLVARMAPGMPRGVTVGVSRGTRGDDFFSSGYTATPGEDYERAGGSILLVSSKYELEDGRWVGRADVVVRILDDDIHEGTETFELNLHPVLGQSEKIRLVYPNGSRCLPLCRHRMRISDEEDRPALEFAVSPAVIMEKGETAATATVSVTGDGSFAADQAVTLRLEGTASRGADYVVSPADADAQAADYQVNLPANSRSVDVTFRAMDDDARDPNEKIEVRAVHDGAPVGAMQTIRIIERGIVNVEVAQPSVAENAQSVSYAVRALTGGDMRPEPGFSMEVPVRTVEGSASNEIDFTAVSRTVSFRRADFTRAEIPAGSGEYLWVASKQGEVAVADEEEVERDENFSIVLDPPPASSGFVLGAASAEVAITNDDRWGFLVEVSPESIREGEESEVTLTLRVVDKTGRATRDGHCVAAFPVTASLIPGGTASGTDDYAFTVTSGNLSSVRLAGCQPSGRVTLLVRALTDHASEAAEDLTFAPSPVDTRLVEPDPELHRPGTLRIENVINRPAGPQVEITFEDVQPPRDAHAAGVATGPFLTRLTFSEPVQGFGEEDIRWWTQAETTLDGTNIGVLTWDFAVIRAGLEYTARAMPDQNGRLNLWIDPGAATSVATGAGNQVGGNSVWVDLPPDRLIVAPIELTIDEGDGAGASFMVVPTSAPTGTVTVMVTGTDGTDLEVDLSMWTFGLPYWNRGRVVTVTAAHDDDTADERVGLWVKASGGGYDGRGADLVINIRDDGASASADAPEESPSSLLEDVTPELAAAVLFGDAELTQAQRDALDRLGNRNGKYDLGDLLAWVQRHRDERSRRPRRRRSRGRAGGLGRDDSACRLQRRRPRRFGLAVAILAVAGLASGCDRNSDLFAPSVGEPGPDAGFVKVELRVPAGARDLGAWLMVEGLDIGSLRAPGFELFESATPTGKEVIVAGAMSDGPVLEFHVPDRALASQYRVRLIEVTGEDFTPRDVAAYTVSISR